MKLVEILARELDSWGADTYCYAQDSSGEIYPWTGTPEREDGLWIVTSSCNIAMGANNKTCHQQYMASDASTAIVTREMWQAERERIAKPDKKANKDGWIRHRGGKCPVDGDVVVEIRCRYGCTQIYATNGFAWDELGEGQIMAYRIHKPAEQPVIEPAVVANVQALNEIHSLTLNHQWVGRIERKNPLQWRDRITEIDRTVEALEEERVSLVQRLEVEGFRLIERALQPVEDMSDWRNWRVGDLICIHDTDWFAWSDFAGKPTQIKVIDNSDVPIMVSDGIWLCPVRATWHSRPSK